MVRTVDSVTMSVPASDPSINEAGTFDMDGSVSTSGSHVLDIDVHMQFDQGTSTWIDITGSGDLSTADTNPANNHANANFTAVTVTGNVAGSYQVRIRTVDHGDGDAEDLSAEQTVTVNAAGRRVMVVS